MSDRVVWLPGAEARSAEPEPGLLDALDELREMAARGEIVSIAYVFERPNSTFVADWWRGLERNGIALLGMVNWLSDTLLRDMRSAGK